MQTLVFKLTLDPNEEQENQFSSHIGAMRFAYNWSLQRVLDNWTAVKEGKEAEYINKTGFGLLKAINEVKHEVAPWWNENSKYAFTSGARNAGRAFENYIKSLSGQRKGIKSGVPKFKTKHHDTGSGVTFASTTCRLTEDNRHFVLPRIGTVRIFERAKALRWILSQGGRITQATLKKEAFRWVVLVNVKVEEALALQYFDGKYKKVNKKKSIGVDLGIKTFLTNSEGGIIANPQHLRASLTKLRKEQKRLERRRGFNKNTSELSSTRWNKAHKKLVKQHTHVANQRKDYIHKVTKSLIENYEIIGIENLHIGGMVKNRTLSLSISDAGWGEFKRQLHYKSIWYKSDVVEVSRFYPSSKTCSNCGKTKDKLTLHQRTYKCEHCGLKLDRDHNAALNIEKEALRLFTQKKVAPSCEETKNGHGDGSAGSLLGENETTVSEVSSKADALQALNG